MVTVPTIGQTGWGPVLNTALTDLQNQITSLAIPVEGSGAAGDGVTDDKTVIQGLLDAAPPGAVVYLGAKRYGLASKLTIPPYIRLAGPIVDRDAVSADDYPALVPLAGFSDATVIDLLDADVAGYPTETRDVHITGVNIDGVNLTTETVSGIRGTGFVHGTVLRDVGIAKMTDHSIVLVNGGADGDPYSWYFDNVQINGKDVADTTWDGFHLIGTDHHLVNCRTIGVRGHGYYISGAPNTQLDVCRAEWSALSGFYITGSWGTGQGSGGAILSGCSTDRNSQYGVLIDSTGNAPIVVAGLMARRDGRNGFPGAGGGGFAALRGTNATTPIIVTGMTCYPGVGDDGLGTNSPERAVSFGGCTWALVADSYLHAATTAFHDAGTNTVLLRGPNTGTATGTTAAPTRASTEPWAWRGTATNTTATDASALDLVNTNGAGNTNPHLRMTAATTVSAVLAALVAGDSTRRIQVFANGDIEFGPGNAARDVKIGRGAANRLDLSTADLRIVTAGRGLQVAEGANAKMGVATLVGGTLAVATTAVTANSRIFLTCQTPGGTPGFLRVSTRTAGTSFTILSSSGTDTSVVAWMIVEPA
jgi:hypothetical protein